MESGKPKAVEPGVEALITEVEAIIPSSLVHWGSSTLPVLLESLESELPLKVPLIVAPSSSTQGSYYDGAKVFVHFTFDMAWASVQLHAVQGYAMAWAISEVGFPSDAFEKGVFHSRLLDFFFHLGKKDDNLALTFRRICVPAIMVYIDSEMARASEEMN